ncbi:putative DNA binding domain-containing protein [Rhodospirillales bacterium]|nr:putative DNA binding domain-containing protein [Rhodospirillales bacterium]
MFGPKELKNAQRKLSKLGETQGYITYDDLNDALPPGVTSSEQIEDTMALLDKLRINIKESHDSEDPSPDETDESLDNPLSTEQRELILGWSNFAKKNDLLEPSQRRQLYLSGKFDVWNQDRIGKTGTALSDLLVHLPANKKGEADDIITLLSFLKVLRLANRGSAIWQNLAGFYWYYGLHAEVDFEEAVTWYKRAAEQHDAESEWMLGECYHNGNGVVQDFQEAFYWFDAAAGQDEEDAQFRVGEYYYFGYSSDVEIDYEKSFHWFEKAANQGNAEAQHNLGIMYENGEGVEADSNRAAFWYKKADENNVESVQQTAEIIPFPSSDISSRHREEVVEKIEHEEIHKEPNRDILNELIKSGENSTTEFKSSARWDYGLLEKNTDLELAVVREVTAFMNSQGGQLLVGVRDDGKILGIENDIDLMGIKTRDRYQQWLMDTFRNCIGKVAAANISVSFYELDSKDICIIEAEPSELPVFITPPIKKYKGEFRDKLIDEFFIRSGNSVDILSKPECIDYVLAHWPSRERIKQKDNIPKYLIDRLHDV